MEDTSYDNAIINAAQFRLERLKDVGVNRLDQFKIEA